ATLVIEGSEIRSVDRGSTSANGYVCAPSTEGGSHGFLFTDCTFTSDAADGSVFLGRPWHPSSNPDVAPSAVGRDSHLPRHIRTPAWCGIGGWPRKDGFRREQANTRPGAAAPDQAREGRTQRTSRHAAE